MILEALEQGLRWVGAAAIALFLGAALYGLWRAGKRPHGRATGHGRTLLRGSYYVLVGVGFFGACLLLWKPLPLTLTVAARAVMLALGTLLMFAGLGLWWWARRALGEMFDASCALGARLFGNHRLITAGPYALVRHPMYLSEILAAFGGLFLYRTWTFVFVAVGFLGLVLRARREEEALASEFGAEWEAYCQRVPGWFPRLRRAPRPPNSTDKRWL